MPTAEPEIPSLGASGAISASWRYIMLYPFRRVTVLLFRIFTEVPAYVPSDVVSVQSSAAWARWAAHAARGVAYGHSRRFIAGVLLIKPFTIGREHECNWTYQGDQRLEEGDESSRTELRRLSEKPLRHAEVR